MIEKAKNLPADEVFLDLEDAVAPDAKAEARTQVAVALAEPGWAGQLRGVRVNDWTTPWTYADVIEVVSTAGASLDIVVLPKVTDVSHIHALDLLLSQLEATHGLPVGRIGIEAQIENAQGLTNIDAIAAGPRVQALVLGPADMAASLNMRTLEVGEQPEGYDVGDAHHHVLMRILIAARTHGVLAIDGPYLKIRDVDGFRRVAGRSAALGYDGKWVLHPDQIAGGQRDLQPAAGGLRPRRVDPGGLRVAHLARRRRPWRGDARRRDDRRGEPQDGVGDRGQGPRRGHGPHGRPVPAAGLDRATAPTANRWRRCRSKTNRYSSQSR